MNIITKIETPRVESAAEFLQDLKNFDLLFNRLRLKNDLETQTKFLDEFFSRNPWFNAVLWPLFFTCMNAYGNSKLAFEISRVLVESSKQISDSGQNLFKLPLINESVSFTNRIGEVFDQAASTVLQMQLGTLNSKPIMALTPTLLEQMNTAALPYLEDCYEVVTNPLEVAYYYQRSAYSPYIPFFYKYSDSQYGHNSYFSLDCYQDLVTNNINPYPFQLKDITINKAMKFLKPYGIKLEDKFVLLHLREAGYIDANQHVYRNSNPKSYDQTVKYFLSQGLKVIRIGHERMTHMFEQSGFLDLTQVSRPDEVDIFLAGKAQFYFGSASGPSSVSYNFGVPCCLTGLLSQGVRPNTFAQFMKLKDTSTGKILNFNDIDNLDLKDIIAPKPLDDRGLKPIALDSSENLKFAKETLEYLDEGHVFELNKLNGPQRQKHRILGGLCSSSLPLLDKNLDL